jgi:hypothetical protein
MALFPFLLSLPSGLTGEQRIQGNHGHPAAPCGKEIDAINENHILNSLCILGK